MRVKNEKRTKKAYLQIDDDERRDTKQPTVLTIECLRQVNKTKHRRRIDEEETNNEEEDRQF